jgi:hypothetical protein
MSGAALAAPGLPVAHRRGQDRVRRIELIERLTRSMRVVSSLWVAAHVRRANGAGAFAVVARRGAAEAGAIFVKVARLDGTADLYGPAPQSLFDEDKPTDRRFERVVERGEEAAVEARLRRETDFDPDLWIVEIEDRQGRSFLEDSL